MVSEVVIRISNADVEDNPSVEFQKIFLYVAATLEYEINNIEITITTLCIFTILNPSRDMDDAKWILLASVVRSKRLDRSV